MLEFDDAGYSASASAGVSGMHMYEIRGSPAVGVVV